MAKDGDYAIVRLPSTETRMVHLDCRATVGQVSNVWHARVSLGKAGVRVGSAVAPTTVALR